jgi:hypothetical protein
MRQFGQVWSRGLLKFMLGRYAPLVTFARRGTFASFCCKLITPDSKNAVEQPERKVYSSRSQALALC